MEQINDKLIELKLELKRTQENIDNKNTEIVYYEIDNDTNNLLGAEIEYNGLILHKRELLNKIDTLNKALDILKQ